MFAVVPDCSVILADVYILIFMYMLACGTQT
nr:MAG TPA: hypothetical protein [Caudoviricetes sp.]